MTNIEKKRLINAFSDHKFQLDLKNNLVVVKKFIMESDNWIPGGYYSLFSSESGYNFVDNDL